MEYVKTLQKIRKQKGFTQQEIADIFQTTQQQISKYEIGEQEIPIRHIIKLSKLYKVSTDQLLGLDYYEREDGTVLSKFEMLFDEMKSIFDHLEYQGYISKDACDALYENLYRSYNDINSLGNK